MDKKILFISNGYGEDTIASSIVRSIRQKDQAVHVLALPLVGEGKAYEKLAQDIIGPRRLMPSGGMIPGNPGNLMKDFFSGLGRLTLEQIKAIKGVKSEVSMTVAVGDIYPVIISALFSKRPIIMVGTAKSDYFYCYNGLERFFMRSSCIMTFPRDEITARSLRKGNIEARWVGNAMMDSLEYTGGDFSKKHEYPCVGILPGSRAAAYKDIVVILETVEELWRLLDKKVYFLMAVAGSTDMSQLADSTKSLGWELRKSEAEEQKGAIDEFVKDGIKVLAVKDRFGDVLLSSTIIVGQAGTGNEQAVGLGRPVVTFDSDGKEEMGWYRLRQKGLLGDSISVVQKDRSRLAEEVCAILKDKERYQLMGKIGHERMGPAGAADQMADYMIEQMQNST